MQDNEIYPSGGSDFCLQTLQLSVAPVILFCHGADQSESRKERERERWEKDGSEEKQAFQVVLERKTLASGCFQLRTEGELWELLKSAVYHRVLRDGCVSSRTTEARHMKTHPSPLLAEGHGAALAAKTLVNSHNPV